MHWVQHPSALISNLYDIYALNASQILEESGFRDKVGETD